MKDQIKSIELVGDGSGRALAHVVVGDDTNHEMEATIPAEGLENHGSFRSALLTQGIWFNNVIFEDRRDGGDARLFAAAVELLLK